MSIPRSVLDQIGRTPMLEVQGFDTGPCRLFVKLENQNPTGSIKDRIGLSLVAAAERDGLIAPGGTLIEATAGNTGLGLALVAAQKGYKLLLVVPDKMAQEKIFHLKALGADVRITRSDVGKGHPEYYQDIAERLAAEMPNSFYVNQFGNPANPHAHETTTGPEIWEQMAGDVDAVVCGVGSGGTITGLTRYFRQVSPDTRMVLADPEGSVLVDYVRTGAYGEAGSWLIEGIGEDFIPPICDLSAVHAAYSISDAESLQTARALLRKCGVLGGSSTGTLLAGALRYCREQTRPQRVVTFVCDSGNKYLSKMYNDFWMFDQGLLGREQTGNLLDLIARRYADGSAVTVREDDTLIQAYRRMKLDDVSQLPVMQDDRLVGIIDESDILMAVHRDPNRFEAAVASAMVTELETVDVHAELDELLPLFDRGRVAIVEQAGEFVGLITKIDVLNYLRHRIQ
ncbi:pyridoxal-phosphate dependent enzyme [Abyssibacter profundi]|uniref:Cysteine synthase B n=1 Tax=Abyssibacter profundi TaxID=2182787 RepID=A0A363UQL7_9GAMM|nr:pyridoxal-phosphate dependent enzyme [Abyssibacter profundi]PWN57736.1 cystathionine beta-synthase [Abyssibacter profundi]